MPASSSQAAESTRAWIRHPLLWLSLFILLIGAGEDLYGNTDSGDVYGSDAVQYLDIARALARHDGPSALNPLWSQGYPALLALTRAIMPSGAFGDWLATRVLNYLIFSAGYVTFLYLYFILFPQRRDASHNGRTKLGRLLPCLFLFVAVQTCLGQPSRVNPDELLTVFFLLACAQMLRLLRRAAGGHSLWWPATGLGLTLGLGFLVKAAFLGLGCGILLVTLLALARKRRQKAPVLAAATVFAGVVLAYGAALSHATGYLTLGEAGSINYAWHVDRLQKWVHWEGGIQPASEAWPKPSIARFAQWDTHPPDFGAPLHPSTILQLSPTIYGFAAPPLHATYVPYFDPPYFYQGYRHVFRIRYQLIALVKSLGDFLSVFLKHPFFWALTLALGLSLRLAAARAAFIRGLRTQWPILACSLFGIALYLPVHLEGRYLAGMLLVLGTCALLSAPSLGTAGHALLLLGFAAELFLYQGPAWRNLLHHRSPQQNSEWQMGLAALDQHLPPGTQVGVIAWTPNLHCDWAYIAHLQITSEIASGPDYDQFWHLPPAQQAATLDTFRRTGAVAVFVNSKPPGLGGPEWRQLNGTPLWMVRLR